MSEAMKHLSEDYVLSKNEGDFSPLSAAEELDVCVATIWKLIKKGHLKTYHVGRARRILRQSMFDYKFGNIQ